MKPKIVIDADRAITLLEEVVAGNENFVYPHVGTCRYARGRKPDCLIAQALHKAGVSGYALSKMDTRNSFGDWNSPTIAQAFTWDKLPSNLVLTQDASRILNAAQQEQDAGRTWGVALAAAKAKRRARS